MKITRFAGIVFARKFASAELFAGLAVLTFGCILVEPSSATVQYQPLAVTTFFPNPRQLQVFIVAVSGISALTYYGLAGCSQSFSKFLFLAQFVLLMLAALLTTIAVMSFASVVLPGSYQSTTIYIVWHPSLFAIAFPSFASGCIVYIVNICIAAIKHFGQRGNGASR